MTRPRFLIDVDDVLADFAHPAADLLSEVLGKPWTFDDMEPGKWDMFGSLSPEDYQKVHQRISDPEWYGSLLPSPGSQDFIKKLRGMADTYVLTSAMSWADVRIGWLHYHFEFDKQHLVFTKAKHIVAGDFFLDDHPEYVHRWQRHNPEGKSMLWSASNNAHLVEGNEAVRVTSWDVVLEKVEDWVRFSPRRPWM